MRTVPDQTAAITSPAAQRRRAGPGWPLALLVLAACAGCANKPMRDGAPEQVPAHLQSQPDPEPRIEPVRAGGPNRPYEVLGQSYAPATGDPAMVERGLASWYGRAFHGKRTASGEAFDMFALTAAHKTMPIPSYARVRNPANGREIIVRINDRGPFAKGRIIDLSYAAALKLGVTGGVAPVEVERITHEAIRNGARRQTDAAARAPRTIVAPLTAVADDPQGPQQAHTRAARGFWLQLGAFAQYDNVVAFRRQVEGELDWLAPLLAVFHDRELHRLQAGPYGSLNEAQQAAQRLRQAIRLVPVIVERR